MTEGEGTRASAPRRLLTRWVVLGLVMVIATMPGLAGRALSQTQKDKPCKDYPHLAGPCFTVHGRMRYYNGWPVIRIWKIGTNRVLGVAEIEGYCHLPRELEQLLDSNQEIFADFVVCPLTKPKPGVMQQVCVQAASKIMTKPYSF